MIILEPQDWRAKILKYQLIIIVGIFALSMGFLGYNLWKICNNQDISQSNNQQQNEEPLEGIRRKIDGVAVAEGKENLFPAAVMIDNSFDAWPTYGLSRANIVYETLAEGATTRFLALYTPDKEGNEVEKIGPVRSTRPYFLYLAKEYDALLAHSGGSPEALKEIQELPVNNLEEIASWGPEYFWRVYSRMAPHNLFTSEENLRKGVRDWELADIIPDYQGWRFSEELAGRDLYLAKDIKIDFSLGEYYDVKYEYSTTTEKYLRSQGDKEYLDGINNKQIGVDNVVIQIVPAVKILDAAGRIELKVIGRGQALIFRDGIMVEGTWEKGSASGRTIFYDGKGEEIKFKPGSIWIEIVPEDRGVEVK